jgi:acyl carrier protein
MDVLEKIKKAIAKVQPGIDERVIVPGAYLKEDLEIDSLTMVEMALALEDAFNLTLKDDELGGVKTVGDIISLIESRLAVRYAS